MEVRFFLDANVDPALSSALAAWGIDCVTAIDAGLRTAVDESILAYAVETQRVLVTQDADFLRMAAQHLAHAGIVFWPSQYRGIGLALRFLRELHARETEVGMRGQVRYLKDKYP